MAHFQEVDYCSEEVRAVGNPGGGFRHGHGSGGGMREHLVKETFVQEATGGHHGHGHGHHGRGSGHFEVRESKFEEDVNTRTGEFHERKENFVVRGDD